MPVMEPQAGTREHRTDARGLVIPHGSWPAGREAPPQLEPVRRFINTVNLESGADLLAAPVELSVWARAEGLPGCGRPTWSDLAEVHRLRALLRRAVEERGPSEELSSFADRYPVTLRLGPQVSMRPSGRGVALFIGALIISVHTALSDGTWNRLNRCSNDHCRWVVYDHSRRGNIRWCAEEACGSRARARSYRARRAPTAAPVATLRP